MATTFLCIGDVHLGRPIRRLPEDLGAFDLSADDLAPAAAWRAAVDLALRREVDALLLAGDVVDQDNRFFEAFGQLEVGIRRLVDAGIDVVGVSGNHDAEVLPRLAAAIDGFTLLGADGRWQVKPVDRDGRIVARLLGWSFPQTVVDRSPMEELPDLDGGDGPLIGLVHGDLDQPRSRYAPLARSDLDAVAVDAWLLGHVHVPSFEGLAASRPTGYLGSLVGLDPTETGPHGAWLLTIGAGRPTMEHLPLAPLRWERIEVSAQDARSADDLPALLLTSLDQLHQRLHGQLGHTCAVGVRIALVGPAPSVAAIDTALAKADPAELRRRLDDVVYFVDRVDNLSSAALDLAEIARSADPAGLLARRLLTLDDPPGSPARTALLASARRDLEEVIHAATWALLQPAGLEDDEQLTGLLRRAGNRALEQMLATRRQEVADAD